MGLFDHFRRKATIPQQEGEQAAPLSPRQVTNESSPTVNQLEVLTPANTSSQNSLSAEKVVRQEIDHGISHQALDNVSKLNAQNKPNREIRWPRNDTDARWLINQSFFFVYADLHFIRSKGAASFVQAWRTEKEANSLNRNWFIAQFELDSLTMPEKQAMSKWSGTYGIRSRQSDYCEIFSAVANKPIIFLTQDGNHISIIRNAAATAGTSVRFYTVNDNGRITPIEGANPNSSISKQSDTSSTTASFNKNSRAINAFDVPMSLAPIHLSKKTPYRLPGTNMTVHTDNGDLIRLGKPVMSNTISITYSTDNPRMYAKIYTSDILKSTLPEQKCRLMLSRTPSIRGVCWPLSALLSEDGAFVGILVPKAEGTQLREILLRESTVRENLPSWNRKDMTELALTILNMIRDLQTWHVYIGCLNLASMLVEGKSSVYFVDIDEWQIEGYPVLFDNKLFVPPELQKQDTRLHFYNQDELNYQIAFLLFMLMMPGRLPYAQRNGSTLVESTINQEFAFGMGGNMRSTVQQNQRDVASGFWRFVWDHISYNLGVDFYQTFARGGSASTVGNRYPINKWLHDLNDYSRSLERPDDQESLKLYPTTFRRAQNRRFVRCSFCGIEHPDFYIQNEFRVPTGGKWERIRLSEVIGMKKICKTCYHESSEKYFKDDERAYFKCKGCGEVLYYTNAAKFTHEYMENKRGWEKQSWCPNCKEPYEERKCVDCGKAFPVTVGQYRYFKFKGYELPKRCVDCQKRKKAKY